MSLRKIWRDFYQLWFWNVWIAVAIGKTFGYNQVCKPWLPDIFCNQVLATVESKDNKVSADVLSLCWNVTCKCKNWQVKKKQLKIAKDILPDPKPMRTKRVLDSEIPSWSMLHWGFLLTLADHGSLQYHTWCLSCKLVTKLFVPTHCICSILVCPQESKAQNFHCTKGSRLETKI